MGDTFTEAVSRTLAKRQKIFLEDTTLTPAAVLLLMYPKDGEYCILLNKRTHTVEHHKGEISFPGGAKDACDPDYLATALREAQEEMSIRPQDVSILGELDEVATGTRYGIRVFVGTISHPYPFQPNPQEIAEVLEVPIRQLQDPTSLRQEMRWDDGKPSRTQSYVYGGHVIFGATAQIVQQLLQLLDSVSLEERP